MPEDFARTLGFRRAPELPVADLVIGRKVEEAAQLLPRLFNLCRAAQAHCARLAFGLPDEDGIDGREKLRAEILRDHLLKFYATWPGFFGHAPTAFPEGWRSCDETLHFALFGPAGAPPATAEEFAQFIRGGTAMGRALALIEAGFDPYTANPGRLPTPTSRTLFQPVPIENSVAARHALHPVMRHIAAAYGYGPLWRATGRIYDIAACLEDRLPVPSEPGPGRAIVAATRGAYAVSARVSEGRVTAFERFTPTDHLCAPGGILERSLATLPADRQGYATLLVDILDPCVPLSVKGSPDA